MQYGPAYYDTKLFPPLNMLNIIQSFVIKNRITSHGHFFPLLHSATITVLGLLVLGGPCLEALSSFLVPCGSLFTLSSKV